jgi:hypothetical protein
MIKKLRFQMTGNIDITRTRFAMEARQCRARL